MLGYLSSVLREHAKTALRSDQWPTLRDHFVKEHPLCAACGSVKRLQVHHIKPFHLFPTLELDPANLIVLCMDVNECHLKIGHGSSFRSFDKNVVADAAEFRAASPPHRLAIQMRAKDMRIIV